MAAYHLEGESQMWYWLFKDSEEVITWDALKTMLHTHYGPISFDDHFGDLTKLQQTGTTTLCSTTIGLFCKWTQTNSQN
jgi:hypothetical protein